MSYICLISEREQLGRTMSKLTVSGSWHICYNTTQNLLQQLHAAVSKVNQGNLDNAKIKLPKLPNIQKHHGRVLAAKKLNQLNW